MADVEITYDSFWDVPRTFIVKWKQKLFFFESHFDDNLDDYTDQYVVYELPIAIEERYGTMTLDALVAMGKRIGQVLVTEVSFDKTRRKTIDDSIFENLMQP